MCGGDPVGMADILSAGQACRALGPDRRCRRGRIGEPHDAVAPRHDRSAQRCPGLLLGRQPPQRGLPLYPPDQSVETPLGYPYPPLLAILFRPLALLSFEVAAGIWEVLVLACFAGDRVVARSPRRWATWIALGILAPPIVLVSRDRPGTGRADACSQRSECPWSVALAANIKLFPAVISLWWIGRRDWRRLGQFALIDGAACARAAHPRAPGEPGLPHRHLAAPGWRGREPVAVRPVAGPVGRAGRARRARPSCAWRPRASAGQPRSA